MHFYLLKANFLQHFSKKLLFNLRKTLKSDFKANYILIYMMKKISFLFIFLLGFLYTQNLLAQVQDHTKESISLFQKGGKIVDIIIQVDIDDDWYIYATEKSETVMAMLARINFNENSSFRKIGELRAINPQERYDDIWLGVYTYFERYAEFRQTVKILEENYNISGKYSHMVCSNIEGMCIINKTAFSFQNK